MIPQHDPVSNELSTGHFPFHLEACCFMPLGRHLNWPVLQTLLPKTLAALSAVTAAIKTFAK